MAGIRIICPLKSDIFTIRKYIREFNDINVIKEKDFVTHPKESGYTSYHMVVEVPVAIDNDISMVKVEIQIFFRDILPAASATICTGNAALLF